MAARTFTSAGTDNLWSNPANWDGGTTIPADGDSVTIPSGQTCEYDYNSAYTTGIAGITVTGTLSLTRTAGTYRLFMKAATTIGGTGTFDCGTALSQIPITANHTIAGGAGWYLKGNDGAGMAITINGVEPTIKYVTMTAIEPVGETVLAVDTDLTGDIWADGDEIRIIDTMGYYAAANDVESATIAAGGVGANSITITAGLAKEKLVGAVIVLYKRNVNFIGTTTSLLFQNFGSGKITVYGGRLGGAAGASTNRIFSVCALATIYDGLFCTTANYLDYGGLADIQGGIFSEVNYLNEGGSEAMSDAVIIQNGFSGSNANKGRITNCIFLNMSQLTLAVSVLTNCTVKGCYTPFRSSRDLILLNCSVINNYYGALMSSGLTCVNCILNNIYREFDNCHARCINTSFGAPTETINFIAMKEFYSESIDHDQVAGAYKAWTAGGVTTLQTTNNPTGFTSNMSTVLQNATIEGYWQKEVLVGAGASVTISMALRKSASMTYLPRIIVFNKASTDPFAGGTGLNTFTMTNSTDTWEYSTYVYTNTGTADVTLVIRSQGMNATGTMLSAVKVDVINVDLTSALAKLDTIDTVVDSIKAKTDILKNPTLLIDNEIIV